MRAAALLACFALSVAPAAACDYPGGPEGSVATEALDEAPTDGVYWAYLSNATDIYPHGVFGEPWEAAALRVMTRLGGHHLADACDHEIWLGDDGEAVFEDRIPRIADVTGDGLNDVIVIESRLDAGASLAVYGLDGKDFVKLAATPHIGTPNRWLAPAGVADFNGDGVDDVAYVETPHIGGTLRLWSFAGGEARQIASLPGFSNHRFGELAVEGGVRDCGAGPELILADAGWIRTMGVHFSDGALRATELAGDAASATLDRLMRCS